MQKERFVKVRRDNHNRLVEFMDEKGKIYDYEMAKEAISKNLIDNAELFLGKDGMLHIKSKNDENKDNNFTNLEEF